MIFGSIEFQKELLKKIREIEIRENITVIYIGIVGSISRGITSLDSDYDVKCLFVRNDSFIEQEKRHIESEIRFREFDNKKVYECIAFWEVSAFINFLAEPYIDSGNKYDLWRNVMWLFMTPYSWDPLGIKEKIRRDLELCICLENEVIYHIKIMGKLLDVEDHTYSRREVLRLLHAFLSIQWIKKRKEIPPINFLSLLSIIPEKELKDVYMKILVNNDVEMRNEPYKDMISGIVLLYEEMMLEYKDKEYNFSDVYKNKTYVNNMLNIIQTSISHPSIVQDVGINDYHDSCLEKIC